MKPPLRVRSVHIHPLAIPMRLRFEHATASRSVADPVLVQLSAESPYSELSGWGETLARPYVTGESAESVVEDIQNHFVPRLVEFRAESFPEALEQIDELPQLVDGRVVNAARAAVELALLDIAGKAFGRSASDVCGWMEARGFGSPGAISQARYSGIVVGRDPRKLKWMLRLQRAFGLSDFKIKVAVDGWQRSLAAAYAILGGAMRAGRATLRADANGAWTLADALEAAPELERFGVCALEQPLSAQADDELPPLARQTRCALVADESLLTLEDCERLIESGVRVLNVRIAKNGGLIPALRIAQAALAAGADVQLGCLVGETSILTAAGVCFLRATPKVRFVEGAFGVLLLRGDVTAGSLRFRFRGRAPAVGPFGLGVRVRPDRVARFTVSGQRPINL